MESGRSAPMDDRGNDRGEARARGSWTNKRKKMRQKNGDARGE